MNLHNKNRSQYHIPSNETNILDNFKRKCKYVVARFNSKIERAPFEIPDDPSSKGVFDVIIKEPDYAEIGAEFTRIVLDENLHKVSFEGPSLFSTCTIPLSKEENFEREFGYIQTSKMLFYERELEKLIIFSDFYTNLMHDQEEVLDSTGENNPFYSTDSYFKVPAGHKPPHSIEIKLIDYSKNVLPKMCNNVTSQTSSNKDWGCPIKHEIHQQFFVYLVMRYKENNKWEYKVLFSFDWFIYLKWIKSTDKINNIFEYNCGLNEHKSVQDLPEWIDSEEFYTCNQDQFYYSVDKTNVQFKIVHYPESIYKHKLKRIYENLYKIISNMKKEFENIKLNISNAKKLCENIEKIEDLEENIPHIERINLEGNKVSENLCIIKMKFIKFEDYKERILTLSLIVEKFFEYVENNEKEKHKYREKYRNIAEGVKDLYNRIEKIDLGNIEFSESSESISSKVNKLHNCIKVMNSIEDEFYKEINRLILSLDELCEESEIGDKIKFLKDYESVTLEIRKLNDLIENMDLEGIKFRTIHKFTNSQIKELLDDIEILADEKQVYKDLESLLPSIKKLCELIEKMEFEENKCIKHYGSIDEENLRKNFGNDEFRKISVEELRTFIENLQSIERQLFQNIENLFKKLKKLNEDVERLYLKNDGFRKNFLYFALEVKKLWACIQYMNLEKNNYRDNIKDLNEINSSTYSEDRYFEAVKDLIVRLHQKIKKFCMVKNNFFEKSKFCECNNLTEKDVRNKIQDAIIRRNNEEKRMLKNLEIKRKF